jgi:hypothetical protein
MKFGRKINRWLQQGKRGASQSSSGKRREKLQGPGMYPAIQQGAVMVSLETGPDREGEPAWVTKR